MFEKFHCPDDFYDATKLLNYYSSKIVELGHTDFPEGSGNIVSTVGDERNYLLTALNSFSPKLLPWINSCKDEYCKKNLQNRKYNLRLVRFWVNSMQHGSEVKVHTHLPECIVLVFYLNADNDSGNLILVNTDDKEVKLLDEYPDNQKLIVPVATGDLVIHHGSTPHGVTKYKGHTPRVSVVIQYRIYWN